MNIEEAIEIANASEELANDNNASKKALARQLLLAAQTLRMAAKMIYIQSGQILSKMTPEEDAANFAKLLSNLNKDLD